MMSRVSGERFLSIRLLQGASGQRVGVNGVKETHLPASLSHPVLAVPKSKFPHSCVGSLCGLALAAAGL